MQIDLNWVVSLLKDIASVITSSSVIVVPAYVYARKKMKVFQNINDTVVEQSKEIEKIFIAIEESRKDREQTKEIVQTIKDGMMESLKSQLIEMCVPIIKKNGITTDELEKLNHLWRPYEKMDGNGAGKTLYLKASKLPIIDE